jgi:dipeptidyl aminopeptidase/acylaminoacyl peptidase
MKPGFVLGVLLALGLAPGAAAAPLEAYGKLPFIEATALSPDGAMLAYAITDGEKRTIVIKTLDTGKIRAALNAGANKVRFIQWAGATHLIVTTSVTGYIATIISPREEWFVSLDYNLAKKKQTILLSNLNDPTSQRDTLNVVDGAPEIRLIGGHPFAFVEGTVFVEGQGREGLFKVDLDDNDKAKIVFEGFEHTDGYVVDAQGKPLAESEYDGRTGRWLLRLWKGYWRQVEQDDAPIERPSLLGLGRDGASIVVGFPGEKESVLRELTPDGSVWSKPVPAPDRLIWDPATYKLIGQGSLVGDDERYEFYDPKDEAAWRALVAAYPGGRVRLNSASDDHRKFVLRVDSPTEGPAFALVDLNTRRGVWLGDEYEGIKTQDIAPTRSIGFKARDGLALTGYLTLPNGRPAKDLPLVVLPHGGPAVRDRPGFDWWAQAMASRGYAVLQVNYRGSSGFGWDFQSAGFGQWGRKMQTDLSDGVRFLAAQGTIDPARVCIVGASYGGYAALAGATLDTGVYRCAVSVAGPADLRKMVDWSQSGSANGASVLRYWLRYMGPKSDLAAISPADQADKVRIPILLVHGKDDTVVPYAQSQIMAAALAKVGKPVEFVTLNKEDHWLSQGATRLRMLQAVVAFLEKNNPPT